MGIQREFASALQGQFGQSNATPINLNTTVASASGEGTLHSAGYGAVYGFTLQCTAANGGLDWKLVDATATGINTPVIYNLTRTSAGFYSIAFPRPLAYSRGLYWQTTATGTSATQVYVHWAPRGTNQ